MNRGQDNLVFDRQKIRKPKMKQIFILLLAIFVSEMSNAQQPNVVFIQNGGTRAGILPGVGGRIVFLSHRDDANILKSDPLLWDEDPLDRPEISAWSVWKAYNGHIVWNGPQSEWWIHQFENQERREKKAGWPPDPYLIYGNYEVLERGDNFIRMSGPESKISGLKLEKYVEIREDGSLLFEVEGLNIRSNPVAWDLWLNTRVDGYSYSYVKVDSKEDVRIHSGISEKSDTIPWSIEKSYFYYHPEVPSEGKSQRSSKAFINPSDNKIHAFINNRCFSIIFPETEKERVHPEQRIVEIYDYTSETREEALMELEYHAPYDTLNPGESMKTWQIWEIRPYEGKNKPEEHIRFLYDNF